MEKLEFRDQLPASCPPDEAVSTENTIVYRLSFTTSENTTEDFISHWNKYPKRRRSFANNECIAHGLSVYKTEENLRNALTMPAFKKASGKVTCILQIALNVSDGLIMNTYNDQHYTWWVSSTFVPDRSKITRIDI